MPHVRRAGEKPRVVILGGGFGGAYAAQTLAKRCRRGEIDLTVIDRNNYLLFYPLLVEAGVGAIEPRHVVVPLRRFMPGADFRMAEVISIDLQQQRVTFQVIGCEEEESIHYDHLVFGLGSITKIPPIPGLKEWSFQLKSLTDAVELRDRGIRLLELANTMPSEQDRRDLLRVVTVGANFTGIEFAGEYHAFLTAAAREYKNVSQSEIEMLVLEYADRILPAVDADLAGWAHDTLTKRGVDIRSKTSVTQVHERQVVLTTGQIVGTRTVVWAAGIAPNPIVAKSGLPVNERGYVDCESTLRVKGFDNVWAIGDAASVFDENGKPYAATAQNASRQGPLVAQNILATINGQDLQPFRFKPLGSFAAIGHRSAAAEVLGRNFKGFLGWFLFRGTYLMKMPTLSMKIRLALDWFLELILQSEIVQLGVHRPRNSEEKADNPPQREQPYRTEARQGISSPSSPLAGGGGQEVEGSGGIRR